MQYTHLSLQFTYMYAVFLNTLCNEEKKVSRFIWSQKTIMTDNNSNNKICHLSIKNNKINVIFLLLECKMTSIILVLHKNQPSQPSSFNKRFYWLVFSVCAIEHVYIHLLLFIKFNSRVAKISFCNFLQKFS